MKFFIGLLSLLSMGALAEGVIVTASSMQREITQFNPANVLDGKLRSRWSSKFEFPQNLDIKLPQNIDLKSLEIIWEGAYAKHYTVKVSENGTDWETILVEKNKTNKDAKLIELNEALAVKYLRFDFIEKGTQYGASIYELKFNGKFFTELYSDSVTSEVVPSKSTPVKAPQRVLPKAPKNDAPKTEKQEKPEVIKIKKTGKHIYI